jgi:ABC-type lipoprotein release transport system permease subunit
MKIKKQRYIYTMLLGNQSRYWWGSIAILCFSSLLIFITGALSTFFQNYFIDLQAGPVPHLQISLAAQPMERKEEITRKLRQEIPGILMATAGLNLQIPTNIAVQEIGQNSFNNSQTTIKNIQISAVDLGYPPLSVKVEVNGRIADTVCEIFDTRFCRLRLPFNLTRRDLVLIKEISYGQVKKKVNWPFRIKKKLEKPELYLLHISPRREDPETIEEEMYAFRQQHSLSLFVPDMENCLTPDNQKLLYQVANYHILKPRDTKNGVKTIRENKNLTRREIFSKEETDIGYILVSRPLLDDLNDMGLSKIIKKFITINILGKTEKEDGKELTLLINGAFNTKLASGKNDRIIMLSLQGYNQLTGANKFNTINLRIKNPQKINNVAAAIRSLLEEEYSPVTVTTWQETIFENSYELISFIKKLKNWLISAVFFVCFFCVLNMYAVIFRNTMHHQMLLRLNGLKNLTTQYISIGLLSSAFSIAFFLMALTTISFIIRQAIPAAMVFTTFNIELLFIPICLQLAVPLAGSYFFGRYYGKKSLAKFVKG